MTWTRLLKVNTWSSSSVSGDKKLTVSRGGSGSGVRKSRRGIDIERGSVGEEKREREREEEEDGDRERERAKNQRSRLRDTKGYKSTAAERE